MIKIFKYISQKLVSQGKTIHYLLCAIAEIIPIVTGDFGSTIYKQME